MAESKPNSGSAVAGNISNAFSWDLYRKLAARNEGNLVYSPLSIHTALVMMYHGAKGNTAEELAEALHLAEAGYEQEGKLLGDYQLLLKSLLYRDKEYTLHQANRLYVQSKCKISPEFKKLLKSYYNAKVGVVNFAEKLKAAKKINKWVGKETKSRIKELLSLDSIDSSTTAVLVNAIYFKGLFLFCWFHPEFTTTKPFYKNEHASLNVKMMCEGGNYNLSIDTNLKARALELPYANNELSLVIVLPDEINGLQEVESQLTSSKLDTLIANMQDTELEDVMIPRFKLEMSFSLPQQLRSLGIIDLFVDSRCNLSGLSSSSLSVSNVIHKASIEVNEESAYPTVAAMRRWLPLCGLWPPLRPRIDFVADHPFLFIIRDNKSGAILFMGRLLEPPAESSC